VDVFRRTCLAIGTVALIVVLIGLAMRSISVAQPATAVLAVAAALGMAAVPALAGYQFTAWIVAAVTVAMLYPARFLSVGPVDLRNPWIILLVVQAVMFGMGTQMSLRDFAGVAKMPWAVVVGLVCQFTIMPLVGLALTCLFDLPDEIAAGIILIGSCSSGLASNVMVYLARGNLALSITLTSVATMLAPFITPLWMKLLAGTLVEVSLVAMMLSIIKIVLVPIGAALLHDYLKHAPSRGRSIVLGAAAVGVVWLGYLAAGGYDQLTATATEPVTTLVTMSGFLMGAIVAGVVFHHLTAVFPALEGWMPVASMFGIVYFTLVTTAAGRDHLLQVGGLLFLAAAIHNGVGYVLGYWLSRALGLDRNSARTVALEVGLQNGGMASGVAGAMGKLGTLGLAAAVFSPWMNITGSLLANHWRRTADDVAGETEDEEPRMDADDL
jgi:BASS family bile acid:Na+ symporter